MSYVVKIPKFYCDGIFHFPLEDFQFFRFYINEAKPDKHDFQREV